jgi:hypothetical protein
MEKKLKRREGVKGKIEGKELKSKEEDQEKRSQEDKSDRPHDLEFIHPTSQTKPEFYLDLFLLSV